ncbi:MAG TPA: SgcJ/EcaC family oxidoreductase [Caulobacterales bacterium]|nr:SgcJ/EcaC family oxidoreductase [Caulobacterales bacterium]
MRISPLVICASLFALAACTQQAAEPAKPPVDIGAEQSAISAIIAQMADEAKNKDAAKAASHYTADGVTLMSGFPPTKGPDAIGALYKQMAADPKFALTMTSETPVVSSSGDMAYVVGHYSATMTNPKTKKAVTDNGAFVDVYLKQADGGWKLAVDANVPNVSAIPVVAPAAPSASPSAAPSAKPK